MTPQGTPTKSFSARCAISARARGVEPELEGGVERADQRDAERRGAREARADRDLARDGEVRAGQPMPALAPAPAPTPYT